MDSRGRCCHSLSIVRNLLSVIRLTVLSETKGDAVDVLNARLDIAGGHTLNIHGQNLLLNVLADAGLVLFQYLGFKFPFAVLGNRNFYVSETSSKCLATMSISAVIRGFVIIVILAVA